MEFSAISQMSPIRNAMFAGLACLGMSCAAAGNVPSMIDQVAREQNVPSELFYAIILAESRSSTQEGLRAWPWTINLKGHPHFFQTREEAYSFADTLVAEGTTLFDIGIAQVNWHWHKSKFNYDLWSAFDPYTNLTAAARHFREQYERPECNEWDKAVGCYHRPAGGEVADQYTTRVLKIWFDL